MASRTRLGESMRARKRFHSSLNRAHSPRRLAKGMRSLSPAAKRRVRGKTPLPHLQDPGALVGVDELQDLREGKDLQVAFHLNPSPSPRTSIRPSPR
jgi:putative NADH-flavin reductase